MRSIESLDQQINQRGFPELQRHWRLFRAKNIALQDLDEMQVAERLRRHIAPPPSWVVLSVVLLGAVLGWLLLEFSFHFVRSSALKATLFVWSTLNLSLLGLHCATLIRRHSVVPMESLIGEKLARVLSQSDFRKSWSQSARVASFRAKLTDPELLQFWDAPSFTANYQKQDGQWIRLSSKSPKDWVHCVLAEFLGRKDESRKFRPGQFLNDLRDRKKSVTRFVSQHKNAIAMSREGKLDVGDGIKMLQALLDSEVKSGSPGAEYLTDFLTRAQEGDFGDPVAIVARVWQRDPWVDLTHQQEFFSSASLRGVRKVGRGTKGRLGPFLYLDDPSVSALDLSHHGRRRVRVRMGLVKIKSSDKLALYVDGIEGTNALDREVVTRSIVDYASACGLKVVLLNCHPHNRVPRYYLQDLIRNHAVRALEIAYLDCESRQYLDGFGCPIEPYEYAFARGHVLAIPVLLQPGDVQQQLAGLGRKPRFSDHLRSAFRRSVLWLILLNAVGFATLTIGISNPLMLPILAIATLLGVAAHLWVQGAGVRGQTP